jgi:hypothetical protein
MRNFSIANSTAWSAKPKPAAGGGLDRYIGPVSAKSKAKSAAFHVI